MTAQNDDQQPTLDVTIGGQKVDLNSYFRAPHVSTRDAARALQKLTNRKSYSTDTLVSRAKALGEPIFTVRVEGDEGKIVNYSVINLDRLLQKSFTKATVSKETKVQQKLLPKKREIKEKSFAYHLVMQKSFSVENYIYNATGDLPTGQEWLATINVLQHLLRYRDGTYNTKNFSRQDEFNTQLELSIKNLISRLHGIYWDSYPTTADVDSNPFTSDMLKKTVKGTLEKEPPIPAGFLTLEDVDGTVLDAITQLIIEKAELEWEEELRTDLKEAKV